MVSLSPTFEHVILYLLAYLVAICYMVIDVLEHFVLTAYNIFISFIFTFSQS